MEDFKIARLPSFPKSSMVSSVQTDYLWKLNWLIHVGRLKKMSGEVDKSLKVLG